MRSGLAPLLSVIDSLGGRIEKDTTRLAYAAACAQLFIFRAEIAVGLDRQIALAERAMTICATHRNARLILADLLVERARGVVGQSRWTIDQDAYRRAQQDLERAGQLWPSTRGLPAVKEELDRALRYRTTGGGGGRA
jgi:hypothetical protein